ncbi:hypothetical protein BGZ63DRAFT_396742 [Mariannaea sp. PMI_226]|nr:hypothetical protein BGZ63DRAFT_396742 [Mariannaea sp. PMI_226]
MVIISKACLALLAFATSVVASADSAGSSLNNLERRLLPCPNANLQQLVGRTLITSPQEAKIPGAIAVSDLPENCRIVGPNQFITADFRPDRLTIYCDEAHKIIRAQCA